MSRFSALWQQACEPRVHVLQSAVFIHPPAAPRDEHSMDDSYLTGAPPTTNDEVVRGVLEVNVPSDRTVDAIRVRMRADQVVSILDSAALTVPVSWEQSIVYERTLVYPPPSGAALHSRTSRPPSTATTHAAAPGVRPRSPSRSSRPRSPSCPRSPSRSPSRSRSLSRSFTNSFSQTRVPSRSQQRPPCRQHDAAPVSERSRSHSALRSLVRSSHRSRSRHRRHLLNDVAEVDQPVLTSVATTAQLPPERHRPLSPSPSRQSRNFAPPRSPGLEPQSRGRSVAVRPAGAVLPPALTPASVAAPDDDGSSGLSTTPSGLSTTPGSDAATTPHSAARGRRESTPDTSAPELERSPSAFTNAEASPAHGPPPQKASLASRRDTSATRVGGVRSLSLSQLRHRTRSSTMSTSRAEQDVEEQDEGPEDAPHQSGFFSGLFHHHHVPDKGKFRSMQREPSLPARFSREVSRGPRDSSPAISRRSMVRAEAEDMSDSEPEEEGLFLCKGVHAFEFAFIIPSDSPPYERSTMGRVKWTIKATVIGGGRARSNVEDSTEFYPIVVPTPDHLFATPLSILYHDLHPSLGLLSVSLTSTNISVGGIMNIDIHSPQPPVDILVYMIRVTLETTTELQTRRRGKQKVPVQRHRLFEQGWVPPRPGSASKHGEGDPKQGYIRSPGSDHAWSVQSTVRLPDDNAIRATTMPGSKAAIRFTHTLLVEIVHSRDPAVDAWLGTGQESPMPEANGEGERKIKVFALRQPAIIPSCCVAYNAVTLPRYTRNAAQPTTNTLGAHAEQTHCVCGISMTELTAQEQDLLPPGWVPHPAQSESHGPEELLRNRGKVGELPPDWHPVEKPGSSPDPDASDELIESNSYAGQHTRRVQGAAASISTPSPLSSPALAPTRRVATSLRNPNNSPMTSGSHSLHPRAYSQSTLSASPSLTTRQNTSRSHDAPQTSSKHTSSVSSASSEQESGQSPLPNLIPRPCAISTESGASTSATPASPRMGPSSTSTASSASALIPASLPCAGLSQPHVDAPRDPPSYDSLLQEEQPTVVAPF